jgi:hypothetical protein
MYEWENNELTLCKGGLLLAEFKKGGQNISQGRVPYYTNGAQSLRNYDLFF